MRRWSRTSCVRGRPARGRSWNWARATGRCCCASPDASAVLRKGCSATLVDRRPSITAQTRASFEDLGWTVDEAACDVFEWLQRPGIATADAAIANLFLHHFEDAPLASLLEGVARRTRLFIACEPRRSRAGLAGVSLMPLIGCNAVTLHDGDISVRAGFRDRELSRLWPAAQGWHLDERRGGLFTHLFVARITAARGLSVSPG